MLRLLKVATPATAETVVSPPSVPPGPASVPMARVTCVVLSPVTVAPVASCTATRTAERVAPAAAFPGGEVKASRAGGRGVTVTAALPGVPFPTALITTEPPDTAVTSPVWLTVATAWFDDDQNQFTLFTMLLSASRASGVSCCVAPAATVGDAGLTDTVATPWKT
jgi:hypothetical protein